MPPVRILITGALGYMGQHLSWFLAEQPGIELHGTYRTKRFHHADRRLSLHQLDLVDSQATAKLIENVQPQQIYHLAGNIHAGRANDSDAAVANRDNHLATIHLYEACLRSSIVPRIVFASTGAIYGESNEVITEETLQKPLTLYAESKAKADLASSDYFTKEGLPIIRARLFNYLGPGQDEQTALSRFAHQLARLERQQHDTPAVLSVGSLDAERDFTDIADLVRALILLMEHGQPGEAYNVATGISHPMHWYLSQLLKHVRIPVEVRTDPSQLRTNEAKRLQVDISKLQRQTGWKPTKSLEQTLSAMMETIRDVVASTERSV